MALAAVRGEFWLCRLQATEPSQYAAQTWGELREVRWGIYTLRHNYHQTPQRGELREVRWGIYTLRHNYHQTPQL